MSFETRTTFHQSRRRATRAAKRHADIALAAKRHLAARLGARNRIPEVAAELGLSQFHLAHVFQRQTGLTIHRYLQRLRMASALVRLHNGEENLSRLALDLGFSSHSHFTAVFRRHFGQSPSAVRASVTCAHQLGEGRAGADAPHLEWCMRVSRTTKG